MTRAMSPTNPPLTLHPPQNWPPRHPARFVPAGRFRAPRSEVVFYTRQGLQAPSPVVRRADKLEAYTNSREQPICPISDLLLTLGANSAQTKGPVGGILANARPRMLVPPSLITRAGRRPARRSARALAEGFDLQGGERGGGVGVQPLERPQHVAVVAQLPGQLPALGHGRAGYRCLTYPQKQWITTATVTAATGGDPASGAAASPHPARRFPGVRQSGRGRSTRRSGGRTCPGSPESRGRRGNFSTRECGRRLGRWLCRGNRPA